MADYRIEKDSMGEVKVPKDAYYGAQTQRAFENFPVSNIGFSSDFISALGRVKKVAAIVNSDLDLLVDEVSDAVQKAAQEVIDNKFDSDFVVDIFQTGSGTSTNMNANEVIAKRANELKSGTDVTIHPNDHVNFGQSSNDVIPTTIRVSAALSIKQKLIPALQLLHKALLEKGDELKDVVKTGRTHLMDAMPVTIQQEFGGYARQIELGIKRLQSALERVQELPQGGTAVGTGINTHAEFGKRFAAAMSEDTGLEFVEAENHFEAQATVDAPVELSGQLKTIAVGLMKIGNDFRWMNSGPNSGIGELQLKALQPGSSIMPGKVNPVIEESLTMVCAQVIGNDAAITVGGQSGNFELNVMLPVVAHNLLQSIDILANAAKNFAERSVQGLTANREKIKQMVGKNPVLVTALNPLIGYDKAAKIAKTAFAEDRAVMEVAKEMTDLSEEELKKALNPINMTTGGFSD
ncbi:class II fumarate hydratase [Rhodohalobacter sulfatireducens]|uniref:Fumarate hydratase class II n=1 Tax=Rhodohalobacter sulfatireducens TaxID=2911366 RepID=A0ABS9KIK2_9BACT|nr:class II fumarate hydratase [Rhodohalobacter sulfatireducens]MCG2590682.1 class II fumarate hydratase [Rhodohalobacter sulfatireducens]